MIRLRTCTHFLRSLSFAVLALVMFATAAAAQNPTVAWNANSETNIGGYIVQYGTQAGSPSTSVDVGNVTSRQFTGLTAGATFYFRVLAYNTTGQQSGPSAEVAYSVPSTPSLSLTAVSPTSGPTTGGTVLTLTGVNFVSGATVTVGGAAATGVTFVNSTQLRATTPAGSAGVRAVQVRNPNGQTASLTSGFTYTTTTGAPTLTSLTPTSGPTSGGTVLTLTGTNFVSGATVTVGGTAATNVTFVNATQLRATTPARSAGAQTVTVRNPNGQTASLANGFTYTTTTAAPTLTSLSPTSGTTGGGTVLTLNGTNFVSGATVTVGGTAATNVTYVGSTQLRATTPAGSAGAKTVTVRNPNGQTASLTNGFTYAAPTGFTITSVTPASGPTAGGTIVTLNGTNFVYASGGEVRIGNVPVAAIQFVNSSQVRVLTPRGTAGAKDVFVRNGDGRTATVTRGFTYTSGSSMTSATSSLSGLETVAGDAASADAVSADPASADAAGLDALPVVGSTEPAFRRYLAEGTTASQMQTRLAIANPQTVDANVSLTFTDASGAATRRALVVPARSRRTVDVNAIPELTGTSFSTLLESDQEVGLDRLIAWDRRGLAASLESAVDQPSTRWYFAEGATTDPFELFYLVQNPGTEAAAVQVRYLLPDGLAPVVKRYTVAAGSRATIWVDREDRALATTDVAAEITSVNGAPIVVERTLYVSDRAGRPRGGDASVGVTAPASAWLLEGSTGDYTTLLSIANPNAAAAAVTVTYVTEHGASVAKSHRVAGNGRLTINVAREEASLARAALAIHVQAPAETPVVAERTKWWGAAGSWDDSVSGHGASETGARWLLAEGEQGGARQATTSLVVFNTQATAADVKVTLLFEDAPEVSRVFRVAANGQLAAPMAEAFPAAAGRRFSVLVEAADPNAALVVDRALYWNADGSRTAGADAAATKLR